MWVSLRNPRTVPLDQLQSKNVAVGVDGKPLDMDVATAAMYERFAELIVGWRVYDASVAEINQDTGELLDQPRMPMPATAALVAKLPSVILNRLVKEFKAAVDPQ